MMVDENLAKAGQDIRAGDSATVDTGVGDSGQIGSGTDGSVEGNALLTRLRVIEDQPLESRAGAFVQLHDRLRATLEGGDSPA